MWPAPISELKWLIIIAISARVTFSIQTQTFCFVFRGVFEGPIFITVFQKYQFSLFLLKP